MTETKCEAEPVEPCTQLAPVDMIIFCPQCYRPHIDKPDPTVGWNNPPHRSHLCSSCGFIWRPADICTNGVEKINTKGSKDGTYIDMA